jgi:hypothetical protein
MSACPCMSNSSNPRQYVNYYRQHVADRVTLIEAEPFDYPFLERLRKRALRAACAAA